MSFKQIFCVLIVFSGCIVKFGILEESQCKKCVPRWFSKNQTDCFCDRSEFCNETSGQCKDCGNDFDFWDRKIKTEQDNVALILERILELYATDLEELEKLIGILLEKRRDSENEMIALNLLTNSTAIYTSNVTDQMQNLQEDLVKLQNALKFIDDKHVDFLSILEVIRDLKNKIIDLVDKIKTTDFDANKEREMSDLREKLKKIRGVLLNFQDGLPKHQEDYLNFASDTESDLDLFENIISDPPTADSGYIKNLTEIIPRFESDIEELVNYLLNIIKHDSEVSELSKIVQELQTTSHLIRSLSKEIAEKLRKLLEKEENFYKMLEAMKNEKKYYEEIKILQYNLKQLEIDINTTNIEFDDLLSTSREQISKLEKKMEQFQTFEDDYKIFATFLNVDNITATYIRLNILDDLLIEADFLKEAIEQLDEYTTIDQLNDEINSMVVEVEICTEKILEYCRDQRELKRIEVP